MTEEEAQELADSATGLEDADRRLRILGRSDRPADSTADRKTLAATYLKALMNHRRVLAKHGL